MKKLFITVLCLMSILPWTIAQNQQEGVITYETKINLHRRIPADRAELKNRIPEFQTLKSQLFFKDATSFYTSLEEDDETSNNGMRWRMPQNEVYLDFGQELKLEAREILGKNYLIQDTLKAPAWKLSDETKTIKGLLCRKATLSMGDNPEFVQSITAWYADTMFLPIGPDRFHSLPGTILEIDINEGEFFLTTLNIEYRLLKKNELKIPTGGKKMTGEEFKQEMEEFRKQNPNGMRLMRN